MSLTVALQQYAAQLLLDSSEPDGAKDPLKGGQWGIKLKPGFRKLGQFLAGERFQQCILLYTIKGEGTEKRGELCF